MPIPLRAILLSVILATFASCNGCKSSTVTGGTSRHDHGGFTVTYFPPAGGSVALSDTRESVATTQPSITLSGDKTTLSTDSVKEGELGGFHFQTQEVKTNPTAWGLIGLLLLAGGGFYIRKNIPGMIACGAAIALAFLAPQLLVWAAIIVIAWLIFTFRSAFSQFVTGAENAINKLPAAQAQTTKDELEKAQDPATKSMVAALKPDTSAATT